MKFFNLLLAAVAFSAVVVAILNLRKKIIPLVQLVLVVIFIALITINNFHQTISCLAGEVLLISFSITFIGIYLKSISFIKSNN